MKRSRLIKYFNNNKITEDEMEQAALVAYIKLKDLDVNLSPTLSSIISNVSEEAVTILQKCLTLEYPSVDLYAVADLFETIINDAEKKQSGVVYTPIEIQQIILDNLLVNSQRPPRICDPSSGCGSFLLTAAKWLHEHYDLKYDEIFCKYIFGIEISEFAVRQSKLLFEIMALEAGEMPPKEFNIFSGDATDIENLIAVKKQFGAFDYIIGNPPYVRSRNMNDEGKRNLRLWKSASVGNVDLYIPFYEIGLFLLNDTGKLGYISPNTFMQAVNGRALRKELVETDYQIRIMDFRDAQLFRGVTSYTCIVWIDKSSHDNSIQYTRVSCLDDVLNPHFEIYNHSDFAPDKRWRMFEANTNEIIQKLESAGRSLDTWMLRNGLATLKNDLYFFFPQNEDDDYYYRYYKGKEYKIEKKICINVAKPNIIRNEAELNAKMEKAIFPYRNNNGAIECIPEKEMERKYPSTYEFLTEYKDILLMRDKGKGKYPEWYAYGRTQGMNNYGRKLLIPYISGEPIAVICNDPDVLFYCGYAVISENDQELAVLKKFLESEAFWYYICTTSKPYSKGYMAFAKNYIAKFTIPQLTPQEENWLLEEDNKDSINKWIWRKYGISQ